MRSNSLFTKAAVLGVLAIGATSAQAAPYDINLTSVTPIAGGATYLYTIDLAARESLVSGDFISIFDFGTFTNASASIAGFTFTNPFLSPTAQAGPGAGLQSPPPVGADDAGVRNLMAAYTGATITGGSFTISANSPFTATTSDFSYGMTTDNVGPAQGKISTVTPVAVPVIPEPGTMALAATGLLPLAGALLRRRRSN